MQQRPCLATAEKAALRGGVGAGKRAIPDLIAHKQVTAIARRRKRLGKAVTGSQEPQFKKASVDTSGIDINPLIDRSGIVLD